MNQRAICFTPFGFLYIASMSYKTGLYYSNWSIYQKNHFVHEIPLELVTHLFYAFVGVDEASGRVQLTDPWADTDKKMQDGALGNLELVIYQRTTRNPDLKFSMSIGGWGKEQQFRSIVASPDKLKNFVESAVEMCKKHQFDGIDIDWEYPRTREEGNQLLLLLQRLREAMGPAMVLTIAAPAGPEMIGNLRIAEMNKHLSFWNLMCYDYSGSWSSKTGYHLNLYGDNGDNLLNGHDVIQAYIDRGVEPSHLVLGMPSYGRSFSCSGPQVGLPFSGNPGSGTEEGSWAYKMLPVNSAAEYVDEQRVSAYCYDAQSQVLVTYDNPQTVRMKADYIRDNNLGGGMFWESCGDDYTSERSLLWNFTNQLNKRS